MKFLDKLKFDEEDIEKYKATVYKNPSKQFPHTLFIGCSDSRIVPSMITKTMPGEIFVIRNIANFVPPFREINEHFATTSAIEYAVQVLHVDNIIVCGHSNCGGCQALYMSQHELDYTPHVKKWLELGKNIKETVESELDLEDDIERSWHTEQINVVSQMENLLTYPFIKSKYEHKKLNIFGWYYVIETKDVYEYSEQTKKFELLKCLEEE